MSSTSSQNSGSSDHGDFATGLAALDIEDVSEDRYLYQTHQYFPIYIGQIIAQKYRIIHKLGHGGFSTVWLAQDLHTRNDVALKIMASGSAAGHELSIQDTIRQTVKDTSHLLLHSNTFLIHDCGHAFRVFVLPAVGRNVDCYTMLGVPIASRMSAARQLLRALESLHKSGIVHGDVNANNVLWGMTTLKDNSTENRYKHLGRPQKVSLTLTPPRPAELVAPAETTSLRTETVYLCDFGLSSKSGTQVMVGWRPSHAYCAPERVHKLPSTFASDMWSYICVFTTLYFGFELFTRGVPDYFNALGPMPEQWKGLVELGDEWYDQTRKPGHEGLFELYIGNTYPDISADERAHVLSVIKKVFRYCPEERLTATQLLEDPSFKALMKIHCD